MMDRRGFLKRAAVAMTAVPVAGVGLLREPERRAATATEASIRFGQALEKNRQAALLVSEEFGTAFFEKKVVDQVFTSNPTARWLETNKIPESFYRQLEYIEREMDRISKVRWIRRG